MRRYRKKRIKTNFLKNIRVFLRKIRRNTVKFYRRRTKKRFLRRLRSRSKKKTKNIRLFITKKTKKKQKNNLKKQVSHVTKNYKVLKNSLQQGPKLRKIFDFPKWFPNEKYKTDKTDKTDKQEFNFNFEATNEQKAPVEPIQQQQSSDIPETMQDLYAYANNPKNIKHRLQQHEKKNSNNLINKVLTENKLTAEEKKQKYKKLKLRKKKRNKRLRLKRKIAIRKLRNLQDKIPAILRHKTKKPQINNLHKRKIKQKIPHRAKSKLNFVVENSKIAKIRGIDVKYPEITSTNTNK